MNPEKVRLRPTSLWILFGPIFVCIWLAAVNYSNNLVYAVLYLIGSLTCVSIFHTWRNLAVLKLEHVRVHPTFAGGQVRVELFFRNTAKNSVYGLTLSHGDREKDRTMPLSISGRMLLRVAPGDTREADVFFPAHYRGRYELTALLIRSSYPFGLFYSSVRVPIKAEYFIYPQARGRTDFPPGRPRDHEGQPTRLEEGDDFAGVRQYTPGESFRHIDWKAFARGRPLSVKKFASGERHDLYFDPAQLPEMSLEDRLSQLTLWVITAEKSDLPYGLQVGDSVLPPGLGSDHAKRALEILAVARAVKL